MSGSSPLLPRVSNHWPHLGQELGVDAFVVQAAGYFVLSSGWEGFGNVLVEALGCGCGIVSCGVADSHRL